jgi:hypothetical protein
VGVLVFLLTASVKFDIIFLLLVLGIFLLSKLLVLLEFSLLLFLLVVFASLSLSSLKILILAPKGLFTVFQVLFARLDEFSLFSALVI